MKKFVGFYYRCSFKVCLCAFLTLIGLMVLSSSAFALQYEDFTYGISNSTVTIYGYTGNGGAVVIPATIDGMPVTRIYDSAFFNCNSLTSVTIPNSVTSIGGGAFRQCSSLTSVTIPNSVTSIGAWAFASCTGLTSVAIGNSVTSIGYHAFDSCTSLTSVIIPDSVTSIGEGAFAFCTGLTSVTIGNSVKFIEYSTFFNCTGLTSVTIPNSVMVIRGSAFAVCTSLTSVTIPNSVTSIGVQAFSGCSGLTSIDVDENNAAYSSQDGVLYDKAMTVLIQYPGGKSGVFTIPYSVTSIGPRAFTSCGSLTSVTIPDSVTSIGNLAFGYCTSLTSVAISGSVTSIGNSAFSDSPSLAKAYFLGNAPSMGSQVFYNCSSNFHVCYTAGSTGFTNPWYGYPAAVCEATLIELSTFTATPKSGKVILQWNTESEIDNAGFNIYRSESENGNYTKINASLIPAKGSPTQGSSYEFVDKDVKNRKTYYYKLEDIDLNGTSTMHGPVSATPRLFYWISK